MHHQLETPTKRVRKTENFEILFDYDPDYHKLGYNNAKQSIKCQISRSKRAKYNTDTFYFSASTENASTMTHNEDK